VLTLGGESLTFRNVRDEPPFVIRLSDNPSLPRPLRPESAFLFREAQANATELPDGFRLYVQIGGRVEGAEERTQDRPSIVLSTAYNYLGDGDVLRIVPHRRGLRVLFRRSANHNSILLTEQCNNYCLMCSQPPKRIDDSWIINQVLQAIPLIDSAAKEITFTGGEPTLLGDDLIRVLSACKSWLPRTAIHVLSNGRRYADPAFADAYAQVQHPDLMVGIPVYSDLSSIHDYVVQADGAFDETIRGILNLKVRHQRVEVRVVIHKQTYERLPQLAEFLVRNLLFVDHVALMGLEITGFTRPNLADLWIDPFDYQKELESAVHKLASYKMNVSIYNHQLCVLDSRLWPYARKSISDWKNEYLPECLSCTKRSDCGGFFSSARLRYSDHIAPFSARALQPEVMLLGASP
jgi:His-Xaa-Ser system radical SAM maturase HxsC